MRHMSRIVRLRLEPLGDRVVPSTGVRGIDGSGNNISHPTWGQAGTDFLRKAPAAYADGVASPAGANRPGARAISNAVAAQGDVDTPNDRQMSALVYAWGQLIDHDLDLTRSGTGEAFNIPVPTGDPSFDPDGIGAQVIPLSRSAFDPNTGTTTPRQQINDITAWLDGSMVYGSDAATAASLRTVQGGRLKSSPGNLLPTDASGNYLSGDTRVNENPDLTSLQTLLMREHNRLVGRLRHDHPNLSDEQLYQRARGLVIGEIEAITYNEWLPALLGPNPLPGYPGYRAHVNPGIANEFATAAFRFGHSTVGNDVEFLGNDGLPVDDEILLADAFYNPAVVAEHGIDPILKYLASDDASEVDTKVVDGLRNFLFGPPGSGGLDLASLNIQRDRDHGLADYNTTRAAYGLPTVTSFGQITHNLQLADALQGLYGNVNNVDLWVGALAEDHVPGGSVGPTLKAVITDQFVRLRDGDRFWYQRSLSPTDRQMVNQTTLSRLIMRNTTLTTIQPNAFVFRPEVNGRVFADPNHNGRPDPGEPGLGGRAVQLINVSSGELVATQVAHADGSYHFGFEDGLRTGKYRIVLLPPPDAPPPPPDAPPPPEVQIKSSDVFHIDLPDPGPPQ